MMDRVSYGSALAGLLLLAWNTCLLAATPGCSASSGSIRAALLELFTSEGCSSCPPADRWLSELRGNTGSQSQLVPLAFHVDYWNQLGWTDRYSKPVFSARQRWIADVNHTRLIYTPQFVLDGKDWRPTRDGMPGIHYDRKSTAELHLELELAMDGQLEVRGEARMRTPIDGAQVYLALYENNLASRIDAGENAGSQLTHNFVVRDLFGPIRLPASGVSSVRHGFSLSADWKRDNLGVSAFVQNARTGEVYQALQRPVCKSM